VNADINAILATKEIGERFGAIGAEPLIMTPEEFMKLAHADIAKWAKVIKDAGVRLE
jgi:tripartite-type tricarboxylate transporter receptor subunit TctC